jgi:hypothetical protein
VGLTTVDELIPYVDWRELVKYPPNSVRCACGEEWTSHTKLVSEGSKLTHVARVPCPRCGFATHVVQSTSGWETMTL